MANIKSAKKRAVQSEMKRKRNLSRKTAIKTAIKRVLVALERTEDLSTVKAMLRDAEAKIARAKGKGLLHENTASRKISRLAQKVAAIRTTKKATATK